MFWRSLPAAPLEHRLRGAFRHRFQRVLRTIAFPESDRRRILTHVVTLSVLLVFSLQLILRELNPGAG